jgi:hypothetical protein
MILLSILFSICLLLISLLSFPIRIRFESDLVCYIDWLFVKGNIRLVHGHVKTDWKLFNRKPRLLVTRQIPKKKPAPAVKKQKKKKKDWNITKERVLESLADAAVKKSLRTIIRFLWRCLKAIRITVLQWNIGLKDYYWQGILFGLLHSIPRNQNLLVTGNFQKVNTFVLVLKISLWRLLSAVVLLLLSFPYYKVFRLYRRVSQP